MKKFVIIGAGAFAREVLDIFEACIDAQQHYEMLGYIVEQKYGMPGTVINDKPILGDFTWLARHASEIQVICGVGNPVVRKHLVQHARDYGAHFGNIVHPSSILARHITMGEGNVIAAGCILSNQITIGNHVHVNCKCTIGHDSVLEDYATLAPGVHVSGYVTLGEGCYIGTGAIIIDRKTIGAWSTVSAGSSVIHDIPSYSTAVGVPATVLTERYNREEKDLSREIVIYGVGGAGRELAFAFSLDGKTGRAWKVKGFVDDTEHLWGTNVNDIPVLGGTNFLENYSGNVAVTIVNDPSARRTLISEIKKNENIKFPLIVSSRAMVSPYVEWGEGCLVLPLNFIQPNTKFGNFVWINGGNRIGHDSIIGDFTTLFSGILVGGGVSIGAGCVIGSGTTFLPGVSVGDGSIIGGGSMVLKDVPPRVVAAGVPVKIIRELLP